MNRDAGNTSLSSEGAQGAGTWSRVPASHVADTPAPYPEVDGGETRDSTALRNRRLIIWIVAGVFVWGTIHAVGAYWNFRDTTNPWRARRAVIVLLSVDAFLGFWLVMLRRRKNQRRATQQPASQWRAAGVSPLIARHPALPPDRANSAAGPSPEHATSLPDR